MRTETIAITHFKKNLANLWRFVRIGKGELVVTHHCKPFFKVTQLTDKQTGVDCGLLQAREHIADFLELLEVNEFVFLTAKGKRKVACKKL